MFNSPTAEHLDVDDTEVDDLAPEPVEEAEETIAPDDGGSVGFVYSGGKNGQLKTELI